MGSYAEFWLDDFYMGSTKNIDFFLLTLFDSSNKRIVTDQVGKLPVDSRRWIQSAGYHETEEVSWVQYNAPISEIRDRLNLLGYTFQTARVLFSKWQEYAVAECKQQCKKFGYALTPVEILESMDVDSWLLGLRAIHNFNAEEAKTTERTENESPLVTHMLEHNWYGFPGEDLRVPLRLAVEVLPEVSEGIYDITDLVLSGYYHAVDDVVGYGLDALPLEFRPKKIIVLTEGRTDSWILSESLEILYPHLSQHLTFMDFDRSRVSGGVGSLSNTVKAFAGAGIINRVIALFDNDTAAYAALRGLQRVDIPKNIKVLTLPNIDLLNNY